MRLQVFLAKCGVSSRRTAATLIKGGKVRVNRETILVPSYNIEPDKDQVTVTGKKVVRKEKVYLLLNKPAGITSTKKDRFAKKTVLDLLPPYYRHLHLVGRLDKMSRGLLLLTNDGELTYRLTHPRFETWKTYEVFLDRLPKAQEITKLKDGVILDGKPTAPCKIKKKSGRHLEVTIYEGRKRQIRRMFTQIGYKVTDLKRTQEGSLKLKGLAEGTWRLLSTAEVERLKVRKG
jgi:23S rRNA pseudouridine2605 synthase/16S rRNA pseudouridine516 synthase